MKVLISTLACDAGKSGVGQYLIHLLQELPCLAPDMQFDLLALKDDVRHYVTNPDQFKILTVGKPYRSPFANLLWQQAALPRICAGKHYDLLFIPAGNRRLPYYVPCPSVGTFHDFAILHVPGKYDRVHTLYNMNLLPALVRKLTMVIADSEFTRRDVITYIKVPEERVSVIPLAASELYHPRNKEECSAYVSERYKVRTPYILYISRIEHPGKNHVRLIRAFARFKEKEKTPHQLLLAGSDWSCAEEVHREAAACSASKDIVFTGFVAGDDLPQLYCASDLFVFPSLFEGFGLPILEAMRCAVPVACSNTSSLPEVAGNAALLFDPYDEDAIEDTLRRILTSDSLREELVQAGLVWSKKFGWPETAIKTLEVFRKAHSLR
ncbi:MAG: glycosyltransferase family 4 protein [Candidatus Hydrogenedentes bacterium]|nr:glycosyltransferase family 4 protein [Candidatus Hydrogenedentota bacterium]